MHSFSTNLAVSLKGCTCSELFQRLIVTGHCGTLPSQDRRPQTTGTESGSARLVEVLKQENYSLKTELDTYYQKVRKLLKVQSKSTLA